ncbi:MAG: histidine kinase, partial [Bacteroidetes bacterium]|nr:histidine kinase [Bacteroidota bacterium]
ETGLVELLHTGKIVTWKEENGLLSNKITSLLKISNSKMLVAGSGGIQLFHLGKLTTIHSNDESDIGTIRQMIYFKKQLYIAADKGLFVLKNNRVTRVCDFDRTTYCLATDAATLWIGTEEGLFNYDGKKLNQETFATLPSGRFINFLDYGRKKLFIGTNNGLYIRELANKTVQYSHFGIQDGVINLETNLNSGYLDNSGNYWFGTASGLVKMKNSFNHKKTFAPRIILKEVLLNYQPYSFQNRTDGTVEFAANKNNISFNFEGISLSQPENLRFQYWLEGADEKWSPATDNSSVVFTSLNSGEYKLHTRAVATNSAVSSEIILEFTILPPFYRTWWFILASALGLTWIIYSYFQFRIKREREINDREKLGFKSKLLALEQQSLNASMNRHFIFNSLNSIQYFINTQDKISANKFLTNFAQLIRKNLDTANNEGNLIPLSKELDRLKLYLSLESMRFKDRFEYILNIDEMDIDEIFIPAMLLQPFVENSIIHGILPNEKVNGEIKINIRKLNDQLEITIEDNGIGISNSIGRKESIYGDHRSQGMEITAKRIELIKKLLDQTFEIVGPMDRFDENHTINGTYVLLKMPLNIIENVN